MSQQSDFATHFRDIVTPRLEPFIRLQGHMVGLGLIDFQEAVVFSLRQAFKAGANWLPGKVLSDLEDWILTRVSEAALSLPPRMIRDQEAREARFTNLMLWDKNMHVILAEGGE